jgi:microcystin-dependent protein
MSGPFVGEIRMFGGNFAPAGWALCNGQLVPIDQNPTLFQLIGTTYGGDGQTTFALPNLQSRVPVHVSSNLQLGETGGAETVTLTTQQIPAHNHQVLTTNAAGAANIPSNTLFVADEGPSGISTVFQYLPPGGAQQAISPNTITATGGSQPHDNMIPFLVINFIISLFGIFPSQT